MNKTIRYNEEQLEAVRRVPYYCTSQYQNLEIVPTLEFYTKRYVNQIHHYHAVSNETVVADIGCGFGWLAMAFALATDAKVIAIEPDEPRLRAGQAIAEILEIGNIEWRVGDVVGAIPLQDSEADLTYCIEVLEHIKSKGIAIREMARVTKSNIVLTTPNNWFPKLAHDSQLPFIHWLPRSWRPRYARLFGKEDGGNLFWSPRYLLREMKSLGFTRASPFLHYAAYADYLATFPCYLPYGHGSWLARPGRKTAYYRWSKKLGRRSIFVMPNLASVFAYSS